MKKMPGLPTSSHIAAARMIRRQAARTTMSPEREPDPSARELKVLTANFGRIFEFMGEWDETVKRSKTGHNKTSTGMEFPFVKISVSDAGYEEKLAQRRISTSLTGPLCRDLSLEEELQARLDRMTRLARSLHYVCSREKWLQQKLCGDVRRCKENADQLVKQIVDRYEMQLAMWQKRARDMDASAKNAEKENLRLRAAIDKMVDHAARTIEELELELTRKTITVKALTIETEEGRDQQKKLKEQKLALQEKTTSAESALNRQKTKAEETGAQLLNMEKTKEHYETLLDIAMTKLKRYEGEGHPKYRKQSAASSGCGKCKKHANSKDFPQQPDDQYSFVPRVTVSTPFDADSPGSGAMDIGLPLSASSHRRLLEISRSRSDSVSVNSLDTASEHSFLPGSSTEDLCASGSKLDQNPPLSPLLLVAAPNATSSPGKWRKKKSKGLLQLLQKSTSLDSQLTESQSATDLNSCVLPPIADETVTLAVKICGGARRFSAISVAEVAAAASKEANQCDVSHASAISSSSCLSVGSAAGAGSSNEALNKPPFSEHAPKSGSAAARRSRCSSPNISASARKQVKQDQAQASGENKNSGKVMRRLKRATSFAALRPKANTFVTLAKDIEKKLKRRRRCKTADAKELNNALDKLP